MTPDESNTLLQVGYFVWYTILGQIIGCIFFGVYIGISVIAIHVLVSKVHRSRPYQIALFMQLCLLVNTIGIFLAYSSEGILQAIVISSTHESTTINLFNNMIAWLMSLNLFIGDTLVIWRAWAIWHGHKWIQHIWIILAVCNAVPMFLALTIWGGPGSAENLRAVLKNSCNVLISLTINILATVAIAYKARMVVISRSKTQRSTNMFEKVHHHGRTQVQKTLWVMVESGAIFCVLQYCMCSLGFQKCSYFAMFVTASVNRSRIPLEGHTPFETYSIIIGPNGYHWDVPITDNSVSPSIESGGVSGAGKTTSRMLAGLLRLDDAYPYPKGNDCEIVLGLG
ncbi:hypothetical protein D9757_004533 [Collybiopsis confluens]|uniref:Uncharacterized protein n=1 Tax=Collybiopsis confluens TaxID=2823264 RepID=A0A8H5HWR0_9AGAR|nr:hypothetical protein D9757_004533 [Collybiopsis confluens]